MVKRHKKERGKKDNKLKLDTLMIGIDHGIN